MKAKTMNLAVVRKYLHLLDVRPEDFEQELLLQGLKGNLFFVFTKCVPFESIVIFLFLYRRNYKSHSEKRSSGKGFGYHGLENRTVGKE